MDSIMKILVSSSDSYSDVLSVYTQSIKKYWNNSKYEFVLATGTQRIDGFTCIESGNPLDDWTSRTINVLKKIEADYIFLMCDDTFIFDYVDEEELDHILRFMKKNDVKFFRVKPMKSKKRFQIDGVNNEFYYVKKNKPYGVNLQIGIFKKEYLMSLLGNGEFSCWEIENRLVSESFSSNNSFFNDVISCKKSIVPFFHGIEKGKWYPNIKKKMKRKGFIIDDNRASLKKKELFIINMKTILRTIAPKKMRRFMKKVFSRLGFHFQTLE